MKHLILVLMFCFGTSALAAQPFPKAPNPELTPGELCDKPSAKRYPEGISYCSRAVGSGLKRHVMKSYDEKLGYQVLEMSRMEFKIDHYIPLCMGGSNNAENLWPQHETIYKITDPLEQLSCEKMAEGRLRQAEAVEMIKKGKGDLTLVPELIKYVESL